MKDRLFGQRVLAAAFILASLTNGTAPARAEGEAVILVNEIGETLFGGYGPSYLLTGKPSRSFDLINWKWNEPEEGIFSSRMRQMKGRMHNRGPQRPQPPVANVLYTRFDQVNLAIDVPEQGWERLDPQEKGANNCLLLRHKQANTIISLAANSEGIEAKATADSLLAASQEELSQLPNSALLPGVQRLAAPGIEGLAYRASARFDNGRQLHYAIWAAAKNGYHYSVAVYGDATNHQAIDNTLVQFLGRMRQIQPQHVAHAAGTTSFR